MGASYGNKSVKIFTKTKHVKINNTYQPKIYGVIGDLSIRCLNTIQQNLNLCDMKQNKCCDHQGRK